MRILIATVTAGAGHVQAAAALEEAWRALRPRDAVERLDVLEFTPKLYRKMYGEGYVKLVEHAPELWALFFKKTDNPSLVRKLTRLRRPLARFTTRAFVRRLKQFNPDVVLCTHFMPLEILGRLKAKKLLPAVPFTASIVTDFEAHALWMEPSVNLYCVAAEETRARLLARHVPPEQVAVTGIPIAAKFSSKVDPKAVRRALGLRDDLPVILVLSGGFGMGPVAEIFLLEHGAVVKANQVADLPFRLEKLLDSARKLADLARAARSLGRPAAATAVCRAVLERLASPP